MTVTPARARAIRAALEAEQTDRIHAGEATATASGRPPVPGLAEMFTFPAERTPPARAPRRPPEPAGLW